MVGTQELTIPTTTYLDLDACRMALEALLLCPNGPREKRAARTTHVRPPRPEGARRAAAILMLEFERLLQAAPVLRYWLAPS